MKMNAVFSKWTPEKKEPGPGPTSNSSSSFEKSDKAAAPKKPPGTNRPLECVAPRIFVLPWTWGRRTAAPVVPDLGAFPTYRKINRYVFDIFWLVNCT